MDARGELCDWIRGEGKEGGLRDERGVKEMEPIGRRRRRGK